MELTKKFIAHILVNITKLEERYLPIFVDRLDIYRTAFTSPLVDAKNNYEYYEFLGDLTANEALVYYFAKRFPQLAKAGGEKTLSRLRIKYSSSDQYSSFAEKLGFWPYIKATEEEKASAEKRQKLLEDVFEAFIGATKVISTVEFGYLGIGNQIVSNIMDSLLVDQEISLADEDLHDAKTRLKEFFDKASTQNEYGRVVYTYKDNPEGQRHTILSFVKNNKSTFISEGRGVTKIAQEKDAAEKALEWLKREGKDVAKRHKLLNE